MNKKIGDLAIYFICFVTVCIVVYKAYVMSLTHDESSSYYYLSHKDIWGYLFNSEVWPNANNHWLNTILFQGTTKLFGENEFAIRLPNVLSFGLYLITSIKLTQYISNHVLQVAAFIFLICNPYLLDFFSTARGYGLSLAFVNLALWQGVVFINKENIRSLAVSLIALTFASLSLFSSLIFIPAIMGPIVIFLLWKYHTNLWSRNLINPLLTILIFFATTLAITLIPLRALSDNAEFKWGSSSLLDGFQSLVFHGAYGQPYRFNEHFTVGVFTVVLVYLILKLLRKIRSVRDIQELSMPYMSCLTFCFLILGMFIARHSIGTFYPVERKTILFIPFIGLILFSGADILVQKNKNWIGYISMLVLLLHLGLSLELNQVREWWYDRDTKSFYHFIADDKPKGQITVGCDWMFHPTLSFYSKVNPQDSIRIMNYNKGIDTVNRYDYYMIFDKELSLLDEKYDVVHKVAAGRLLLKPKASNK